MILLFPILSALIGWLTNFIAIRMIFRPYKRYKFFIFSFYGLIPKRKKQLALKISQIIETHLISKEDIKNVFSQDLIQKKLDTHIDIFLNKRLFEINPLIGSFLSDEIKSKLKNILKNELAVAFKDITNSFESDIDIQGIIKNKIENYNLKKFEKIILEISSKELKAIEIWGGVLGFIIGLIQIGLIYLIN